jgi:hypothetical protein
MRSHRLVALCEGLIGRNHVQSAYLTDLYTAAQDALHANFETSQHLDPAPHVHA